MLPSNSQSSQHTPNLLGLLRPGAAFVAIIFCALVAFEIFNFSTTEYALRDLLGDLSFGGFYWATILSVAFCGIDFAGIARLFTPEQGGDEPKEVWYLFGAWLMAATMNAVLTWWGVSMAVVSHNLQSSSVVDPKTITGMVPVFVAIMVWVIRILIIGTLSLAVDRLIHPGAHQRAAIQNAIPSAANFNRGTAPLQSTGRNSGRNQTPSTQPRPAMSRSYSPQDGSAGREVVEPTYHSLTMSARPRSGDSSNSRGHRL